jgi:catechol 2,3-dioxygenase-like lactoylglutathione lyase family enzyme
LTVDQRGVLAQSQGSDIGVASPLGVATATRQHGTARRSTSAVRVVAGNCDGIVNGAASGIDAVAATASGNACIGAAPCPTVVGGACGNIVAIRQPRQAVRRPASGERMFDHVKFGVSDYEASKTFFLDALAPLGVAIVSEGTPTYGVEMSPPGKPSLCLFQTDEKPAYLHLAFAADDRGQVDAFYRAALAAGAKDNGPPGLRPQYHANYYAAFVIGPDGHNIEVVCHRPEG